MYIIQNLPWFLLLIGALVFFHELGHFLVAKACGIKVLKFSIGFGPRLVFFRRGDTDYQLSLLPLGGYVKMVGELPGVEITAEDLPRAFSSKPLWQRAAVVVAGPLANFLLAIIVYTGIFVGERTFGDTRLGIVTVGDPAWHAGLRPGDKVLAINHQAIKNWDELQQKIAKQPNANLVIDYQRHGILHTATLHSTQRLDENIFQEKENHGKIGVSLHFLKPIIAIVDPQSPAAIAGLKTDDVIEAVDGVATASWHDVREQMHAASKHDAVLSIRRADGQMTLLLHGTNYPEHLQDDAQDDFFSSANFLAQKDVSYTGLVNKNSVITALDADTPAATAGLQIGDRLLRFAVQNANVEDKNPVRPVGVWEIDLGVVGLQANHQLLLNVQRGRNMLQTSCLLQQHIEKDEIKMNHTTYVFGASNDANVLDSYTFKAYVGVLSAFEEAVSRVVSDMTLMTQGLHKMIQGLVPLDNMGGPIMMFVVAERSAKRGWHYFLGTLAMVSVNLGLLNLLPIPVLDGGHLLFILIEKLIRRAPPMRVQEYANGLGLLLILVMMLWAFHNDFMRYIIR